MVLHSFAAVATLTALVGCNGNPLRGAPASPDGGIEVSAEAGAAGANTAAAGAGNGGSGTGGADASQPLQCLVDELPASEPIEIVVENGRAETIRLGNPVLCQREYFKITSATDSSLQWEGVNCKHDCIGASLGLDRCRADCPKPDPLPVEPGQAFTVSWTPLLYKRVPLLPECCSHVSGVCALQCYEPQQATAGAYTLTVILTDDHGNLLEQLDSPIQLNGDDVSIAIE